MNTWVLLRELPELINGSKGERACLIASKLQQHYSDSVDILVLTPNAKVVLHQPETALPHRNRTQAYLTLLGHASEVANGRVLSKLDAHPISLGKKLNEVLQVIRASGTDTPNFTFVEIDTTMYENGGILHIEIQLGEGEATGTFELFDADATLPTEGVPDDDVVLVGFGEIQPRGKAHLFHRFDQGKFFKLGASSLDNEAGSTNAFIARVFVVDENCEGLLNLNTDKGEIGTGHKNDDDHHQKQQVECHSVEVTT